MQRQDCKLFAIGLPRAGKTTFLAALWHVVEFGEVPKALKLVQFEGDKSYLNQIRSLWVDAKPLERTKVADETTVSMLLADDEGNSTQLWIPDLSGESFEAQWTDRVASVEYADFVGASNGGMLFVHPEVREEHLIADIEGVIPEDLRNEEQPDQASDAVGANPQPLAWEARKAPTQVQLVDLLQSLAYLTERRPLPLVIAVSAWDLVPEGFSPASWIEQRLPLLHQYLLTHADTFDTACFGVSAQGGDLKVEDQVLSMREKGVPAERLRVLSDRDHGHDITATIRWLMTRSQRGSL